MPLASLPLPRRGWLRLCEVKLLPCHKWRSCKEIRLAAVPRYSDHAFVLNGPVPALPPIIGVNGL